jgi:uncharacterized protein YndB with AHSA1/START domain
MPTNANAPTADGTLEEVDGQYILHFERRFAHPVERVWAAITEPAELVKWVGANEIELDLAPGGRLVSRTTAPELVDAIQAEVGEDAPLETEDTVLRVEPPRLFEHTFGGVPTSIARWELEPDGTGCILRLAHTEPAGFPAEDAPRDLAGWHTLLDMLGQALDGQPVDWAKSDWDAHRDRYRARMG